MVLASVDKIQRACSCHDQVSYLTMVLASVDKIQRACSCHDQVSYLTIVSIHNADRNWIAYQVENFGLYESAAASSSTGAPSSRVELECCTLTLRNSDGELKSRLCFA